MATIGRLVVEFSADDSKLRRAFQQSAQLSARYRQDIVRNRQEFIDSATRLREDVFRNVLSPAAFRREATAAAKAYNEQILATMGELRNAGQLTRPLHQALVAELRDAGFASADAYRQALAQRLSTAGRAISGAGRDLRAAGFGLTAAITLPATAFSVNAVKQASDAMETLNKFQVVFGPLAQQTQQSLDQLHRTIPATTSQLRDMAAGFNSLLLPMGIAPAKAQAMSVELVRVAGDLQSLFNIPFQEVLERLTSGLVGETQAVRRFGVDISEAALKVAAMNAGLGNNVQALTRAQKTQLIYQQIIRQTGVATGDAAATMDSMSNQIRFAQRNFQELSVAVGTRLIPLLLPLVQRFAAFLERMTQINPTLLRTVLIVTALAAALGPLLSGIGTLMTLLGGLARVAGFLLGLQSLGGLASLMAAGGPWVLGIAAVAAAIYALTRAFADNKLTVDEAKKSLEGYGQAALQAALDQQQQRITALQSQRDALLAQPGGATRPAQITGSIGSRIGQSIRAGFQETLTGQAPTELARINRLLEDAQTNATALASRFADVETAERKARLEQERMAARFKDFTNQFAATGATKGTTGDPVAQLEGFVSQLNQTRTAMQKLGDDARDISGATAGAIQTAYDRLNAFLTPTIRLTDQQLLRLREIRAELGKLIATPTPLQHTRSAPEIAQDAIRAGTARLPDITVRAQAAEVPISKTITETDVALAQFRDALRLSVDSLKASLLRFGTSLLQYINPIQIFASILNQVFQELAPAIEPLIPIIKAFARVIGQALAPIIEALAPALEAILPPIATIIQIIATSMQPVFVLLATILKAIAPILEALIPIIKLLAIATTYVGQAFAIMAQIGLRLIGNLAIGFGAIVEGIARAVDALPGVSARGAIQLGKDIQNFGRGVLHTADEFRDAANDMVEARRQIRGMGVDKTREAMEGLTDTINETTDAMRNVPSWWRVTLAVFEATRTRDFAGTGGPPSPTLPTNPPTIVPGQPPTPPVTSGGGGGGGGITRIYGRSSSVNSFAPGSIVVQSASADPRAVARAVLAEFNRVSLATTGNGAEWPTLGAI